MVLVNVSWTYISDPNKVNFSITLLNYGSDDDYGEYDYDDEDGLHVEKLEVTGVTYFVAQLKDNTLYEVVVSHSLSISQSVRTTRCMKLW